MELVADPQVATRSEVGCQSSDIGYLASDI